MIPAESAHGAIAALGEVGVLQFKDLNADKSAFQRTYANQVKRTDEMSRRLRFFHEQVTKAGLDIKPRSTQDINTYHFDELEVRLLCAASNFSSVAVVAQTIDCAVVIA